LNPPDVLLAYTFFMWASRSLSPWHWLIRASFALQFMHSALHGSRPKRKHRNFLCKSSVNLHLGFFFYAVSYLHLTSHLTANWSVWSVTLLKSDQWGCDEHSLSHTHTHTHTVLCILMIMSLTLRALCSVLDGADWGTRWRGGEAKSYVLCAKASVYLKYTLKYTLAQWKIRKTRTFSSLFKKQTGRPGQDVKTGHVGKQDVWSPYYSRFSIPSTQTSDLRPW